MNMMIEKVSYTFEFSNPEWDSLKANVRTLIKDLASLGYKDLQVMYHPDKDMHTVNCALPVALDHQEKWTETETLFKEKYNLDMEE